MRKPNQTISNQGRKSCFGFSSFLHSSAGISVETLTSLHQIPRKRPANHPNTIFRSQAPSGHPIVLRVALVATAWPCRSGWVGYWDIAKVIQVLYQQTSERTIGCDRKFLELVHFFIWDIIQTWIPDIFGIFVPRDMHFCSKCWMWISLVDPSAMSGCMMGSICGATYRCCLLVSRYPH